LENFLKTPSGEIGWSCTFYGADEEGNLSEPFAEYTLTDTRVKLNDFLPPGLPELWNLKLKGSLTVEQTAPFEMGLTVAG
jgi:beta-glucosidase